MTQQEIIKYLTYFNTILKTEPIDKTTDKSFISNSNISDKINVSVYYNTTEDVFVLELHDLTNGNAFYLKAYPDKFSDISTKRFQCELYYYDSLDINTQRIHFEIEEYNLSFVYSTILLCRF